MRAAAGRGEGSFAAEATALNARYGTYEARAVIELAATRLFPGKVAMVSSFGADRTFVVCAVVAACPVPVEAFR